MEETGQQNVVKEPAQPVTVQGSYCSAQNNDFDYVQLYERFSELISCEMDNLDRFQAVCRLLCVLNSVQRNKIEHFVSSQRNFQIPSQTAMYEPGAGNPNPWNMRNDAYRVLANFDKTVKDRLSNKDPGRYETYVWVMNNLNVCKEEKSEESSTSNAIINNRFWFGTIQKVLSNEPDLQIVARHVWETHGFTHSATEGQLSIMNDVS